MNALLSSPQKLAAAFLALSGLLHLLLAPASGFSTGALLMFPVGPAYILMAEGLRRGWRWLAYVVFATLVVGVNVAYAAIGGEGATGMIWIAILLADLVCAASLFVALWRAQDAAA